MNLVSGRGGVVLLLSEPAPFQAPLVDCDHGFEWRCSDRSRSWWQEVVFERGPDWASEQPREVTLREGRVSFPRSLQGLSLRVRGTCRPLSEVAQAGSWRLAIPASGDAHGELLEWSACVAVEGGDVLCVLPFASGAFRGVGRLDPVGDGPLRVTFREGEVGYGSWF